MYTLMLILIISTNGVLSLKEVMLDKDMTQAQCEREYDDYRANHTGANLMCVLDYKPVQEAK